MTVDSRTDARSDPEMITAQRVPSIMLGVLALVFVLALFWEFYFEGGVLTFFGVEGVIESPMRHLWHVIVVTAFTAIALVIPTRYLIRALSEREGLEAEIRHLASHDGLTGLPNRGLFMDRLQQAMHRAHRDGNGAAVMFLDLDDFQSINDSLGHSQGDAVLKLMADRLASSVRRTDTVARFGGDQFVIVMTDVTDRADVFAMADKLNQALGQPCHFDVGETSLYASIGIALFPDHGNERKALLTLADDAMREAKARGKGRYSLTDVPG